MRYRKGDRMNVATMVIAFTGSVFWGVDGGVLHFRSQDNSLYRMIARDVAFEVQDCSINNYKCFSDSTGFQISYPDNLSGLGLRAVGMSWSIEGWHYSVVSMDREYLVSSPDDIFTVERYTENGFRLRYQISARCGLSYIEFSEIELPNLYDTPSDEVRAFYGRGCSTLSD
jgi:hypothetical protein